MTNDRMNEELTNEVLEAIVTCDCSACIECPAQSICAAWTRQAIAAALLEERAKPKVWDGAPEWADRADVSYNGNVKGNINISTYTRELPKSRARQIAEKEGHRLAEIHGWNAAGKELVTNAMESAINKYAEELEGEA